MPSTAATAVVVVAERSTQALRVADTATAVIATEATRTVQVPQVAQATTVVSNTQVFTVQTLPVATEVITAGAQGPAGAQGQTGVQGGRGRDFNPIDIEPYIAPALAAAVGNSVDLAGAYQLST